MRKITQATLIVEAQALPPVAQLARTGATHDGDVPVRSFQDDLVRKLKLRSVMPKGKPDEALAPGEQYTKEEVNYRYSGRDESCGACKHFIEPGSCAIVAGLIRPVDVCDKFEPINQPAGALAMPGEQGEDEAGTSAGAVKGWQARKSGGSQRVTQKAEPDPREIQRRRQAVKDTTRGLNVEQEPAYAGSGGMNGRDTSRIVQAEVFEGDASEVSPPGWEGTVKRMKRHQDITNPWALAWWMKGQGFTPRAGPRGGKARTVTAEVVEADKAKAKWVTIGGRAVPIEPDNGEDNGRLIDKFTRREKPEERRQRIAHKRVDPERAKTIKRALGRVEAAFA